MLNGLPLQSIMVAKRRAGVVYFYLRVPLQIKAVYQSLLGFPYTVLTLKLTGFYPLNLRRFYINACRIIWGSLKCFQMIFLSQSRMNWYENVPTGMMGSLLTAKLQLRGVIFQAFRQDKLPINKPCAIMSGFPSPSTTLKVLISILKAE